MQESRRVYGVLIDAVCVNLDCRSITLPFSIDRYATLQEIQRTPHHILY
jgi:hypothetical protein